MMAVEGQKKRKFDRIYMGYNPNKMKGPAVNIVDTVVKTIPNPEEKP